MDKVKSINKELNTDQMEMEELLTELVERDEYACTGDACGANACGIN